MQTLPKSDDTLVIRTDFSDDAEWENVCAMIREPVGEFRAYVEFVNDPVYDGLSIDQLPQLISPETAPAVLFIVDHKTIYEPESVVLAVDVASQASRTFRVTPSEMWSVENNLSLANMDWEDFAACTDDKGVFRGFPYMD